MKKRKLNLSSNKLIFHWISTCVSFFLSCLCDFSFFALISLSLSSNIESAFVFICKQYAFLLSKRKQNLTLYTYIHIESISLSIDISVMLYNVHFFFFLVFCFVSSTHSSLCVAISSSFSLCNFTYIRICLFLLVRQIIFH